MLSLWIGFDDIVWPEPIARVGHVFEKTVGMLFIVVGVANVAGACLLLGRQILKWLQVGVWESANLHQWFHVVPHFQWKFANIAVSWLLNTPAWLWAAIIGVLVIRSGFARLAPEHPD